MVKKKDLIKDKIDQLLTLIDTGDSDAVFKALRHALKDKSNFVVAKAAGGVAQKLLYDLIPDLLESYQRFMLTPVTQDKTCAAKRAICRALYELDYDHSSFYRAGIHYRQLEPVWGGSVDTAVEIRCTCALGLVSTNDPRVMLDLIDVLYDEEAVVRKGALQAMELAQSFQAELIIRSKLLQGDTEMEVMAQGFSSLMKLAAENSLEFVARFLDDNDELVQQGAALALGESRLDDALDLLLERTGRFPIHSQTLKYLFAAIALVRTEKAFDFLISNIKQQDHEIACMAIEALSVFDFNKELKGKVGNAVLMTKVNKITQCFQRFWGDT